MSRDRTSFLDAVLGMEDYESGRLRIAGFPRSGWSGELPTGATASGTLEAGEPAAGGTQIDVPLNLLTARSDAKGNLAVEQSPAAACLSLRSYGPGVLRLGFALGDKAEPRDSPMLAFDPGLKIEELTVTRESSERFGEACVIRRMDGRRAAEIRTRLPAVEEWSRLLPAPQELLDFVLYPDGRTAVHFDGYDQFTPYWRGSAAMGVLEEGSVPVKATFSVHAEPQEHFYGSGERFGHLDLAGRSIELLNRDALGTNSRRAYKNVPFYFSSAGYGIFVHSSYRMKASFADVSTRAVQFAVDEPVLDIFVIAGDGPEEIIGVYRRITGFPAELPLWSYGTWMSRMSYFSADEIEEIADRLRREEFPCDVLHIDTGWFARDWICEWRFSSERFPDPEGFIRRLRERGFRVSLWQNPNLTKDNGLLPEARKKGFVPAPAREHDSAASDFSAENAAGQIDFSNPAAVAWYRGLLAGLFDKGVAVIKTDFGEEIRMDAVYHGMPAAELRNLYALLYQRAAFEETLARTGEGIIWARAGWAGCQRYPLHWGGDAAATWDGLAGSLRGGLQLGLSGFGFWSHDVPGFHGLPDFMNSRPDPLLYLRWTQFGALSPHMRYHGTSPREPWHFPEVAAEVRAWLRLRYALIPYLLSAARECVGTGFPLLRALLLHYPEDPFCAGIDDQYLLGADVLVAPIMNAAGIRDIYLPEGVWRELFTGEVFCGPTWLHNLRCEPARYPVFLRDGARIPVYPEPVLCTDEMDLSRTARLVADEGYAGLAQSILKDVTQDLR